jgi:hypothetical protein
MPVPDRPEDELADRFIDELTAELDPDDARELAAELARMVELGLLAPEGEEEVRLGVAPGANPPRPWPLPSRRPDRWGVSPAPTSRRR